MSEPRKYRKKPVIVEAIRFTGSNWRECCRFLDVVEADIKDDADEPPFLDVHTENGWTEAEPGDWILKGPHGDYWPCKPHIFETSYEPTA